ncbi:MAG: asparagine synthase-related protein, partial [Streptosporangiales bacterium]
LRPAAPGAHRGLAAALTDSIDLHLSADVPTALLLSGGVDSAAIAAVGRRLGRDLHCLTVAAEGAADESAEAERTATHYGHRFQQVRASVADEDVTGFFAAMQRPSIDGLNTYLVCRAVRDAGFKVALSGLGGDEALGGYSHFRLLRYLRLLRAVARVPRAGTAPAAWLLGRSGLIREAKARTLLGPDGPRDGWGLSLLQREVLPCALASSLAGIASGALVQQLTPPGTRSGTSFGSLVDAEVAIYLQSTLLPDADAFSMTSSVELRVPFVDEPVFAAGLASVGARGEPPGKASVGRSLDDPYLRALADRPKRGFSVPMREWMAGPLAAVLAAAESPDAAVWSVIDRAAACRAGLLPLRAQDRWSQAWVIAALNAWLESSYAVLRK